MRLITPPASLRFSEAEILAGPMAEGMTKQESRTGKVQTTSSPYGSWVIGAKVVPLVFDDFLRYRAFILDLQSGANAMRLHASKIDPFRPNKSVRLPEGQGGSDWTNGATWLSGAYWGDEDNNRIEVTATSKRQTVDVKVGARSWATKIIPGTMIGFEPDYLAHHVVMDTDGVGGFRILPPLRKDIDATHVATLDPVGAFRLTSPDAANLSWDVAAARGMSVVLTEVFDYALKKASS